MAVAGKKISGYDPLVNGANTTTYLVLEQAGNTYKVAVTTQFANAQSNVFFGNLASVSIANLEIRRTDTPANSTPTVTKGTIWFDSDYLYVAVANNVLKRVSLTAF